MHEPDGTAEIANIAETFFTLTTISEARPSPAAPMSVTACPTKASSLASSIGFVSVVVMSCLPFVGFTAQACVRGIRGGIRAGYGIRGIRGGHR